MGDFSVVEYFADHEGYKCGYCKSPNTNYSHGMWAHALMVRDYQDLIDRGWRRSGKYCYKPTLDKTCCPMYTIKCSVQDFKLSKSHKKVLKRMNRFLAYGKNHDKEMLQEDTTETQDQTEYSIGRDFVDAAFIQRITNKIEAVEESRKYYSVNDSAITKVPPVSQSTVNTVKNSSATEFPKDTNTCIKRPPKQGTGPDPDKPKCRKAKDIRRERKLQKLKDVDGTSIKNVKELKQMTPCEKSLEDYINEQLVSNPVHRLEIQLVQAEPRSPLFNQTLCESYQVYMKYQISIHNDFPEKCSENQFLRFLASGPMQFEPNQNVSSGYGSFHQQYLLDGKIIAVGVIDILPSCISSVYFFYDPQYSFLSLGTYAALREIYFTRELNRQCQELNSYYMGFYIHSCPKMKYKAQFYPSYLLCPETYIWQPYEKCKIKLDMFKYSRLEDNPELSDQNGAEIDFDSLLVLNGRRVKPYSIYRQTSHRKDLEEVTQYATLVGKKCYSKMLLYRG